MIAVQSTGELPVGVTVSPDGNSVYTANLDDNTISQFERNETTGELTPLGTVPSEGLEPISVAASADGESVYVANRGDGTLSWYVRNPTTGIITFASAETIGPALSFVAVSPDGTSVYAIQESGNKVFQFARNTSSEVGELTALTPAYAGAGNSPTMLAIRHDSKFVFVTNQSDNTISQFERNTGTGELTALSPSSVSGDTAPYAIAAGHTDRNVYSSSIGVNKIDSFVSGSTSGLLTPLTPSSVTLANGKNPGSIVVSPDDAFVYVLDERPGVIEQYAREGEELVLLSTPFVETTEDPISMAISADGISVYVVAVSDNTITLFNRDPGSGELQGFGAFEISASFGDISSATIFEDTVQANHP